MHNENPSAAAGDWASQDPVNEIESMLGEIDQLRATVVGLKDEALRERAELDNQRKRLARDVDMARKFANERLLSELLPVLDSLDAGLLAAMQGATSMPASSLSAVAAGQDAKALVAGLDLTLKQLLKVASDNGLGLIDPLGEAFNPDLHQAISQAEQHGVAAGTVLQVFQKGYLLNGRLLRPALVVVARDVD